MNVPVPFEKDVAWNELGPFFGILGLMVLIGIIVYFGAKRFNID